MATPAVDNTPRVPSDIARSRVANFLSAGSNFYTMGIHRGLWVHRHSGAPHVELSVYSVPDLKRVPFKDAVSQTFKKVDQHERNYGPSWATHWFKIATTIPNIMNGKTVVFQWDMGCEGMVWTTDGIPMQGLTGGDGQERHEYIVTKKAKAGERHTFYIEAACNGMFGVGDSAMVPDPNRYFSIKTADLVVPDYEVQDLYYDLDIIKGIAYDTQNESPRAREAVWVINEVINQFILKDRGSIKRCKALTSEFLSVRNGQPKGQHQITAIGNCHIDTAWLWPYDETKRKIARSWSTQVDLMDRYPGYIFTGSQTQQYEWLSELYPSVFEKIKEKEKVGQWEIIGGSWVEHDTNMPSGESLCRQMVLGQRYFEKHFGKRAKIFWLPDSFGYSSQLPQVLKLSGCDYFFTQKLSWNNINKFPLTTFWWTGIDGTNILSHLTPADTYGASVTVAELTKCTKNNHDLEYSNESLLCYGHGDGGGGPTPEMLERLSRLKDVDGLPMVKSGKVLDFFQGIEKHSRGLQSYNGELYLEFHRGTYTTQALVKRGNRISEFLIRDVEILSTMATILAKSSNKKAEDSYAYPINDLEWMWKLLCLNQFHDCLPGSAIGLAFKDVHKHHREIISASLSLRHKAQSAIIDLRALSDDDKIQEGLVAFNTVPWERTEVIEVPRVRSVPGLGAAGYVAHTPDIPTIDAEIGAKAYKDDDGGYFILENQNLKATFNHDGQLVHLVDKKEPERQLIPNGARGNVLKLYEDVPIYWDAWDVEIYHLQKWKPIEGEASIKIVSEGPLKAELHFRQTISDKSWIEQTISLTCLSERLEFSNFVDWHEAHQFLKVEFVWDLVSDYATYEIQYGVLRRPTHYNTTVDSAKFEVCGHKFADLSEANYGVALMNNCKYGYATHGNTQRLSLLRSPKGPDENADMGEHKFKYAIYPHQGHFNASNVVREAIDFNVPLSLRYAEDQRVRSGTVLRPLFQVDPPTQIILDTIKPAEDDQGKGKVLVLRLYEAYGGKATALLKSRLSIKRILVTNVLEDDSDQELPRADEAGSFKLALRPFQILTLKVQLSA
ncbi:glycosyl hydrolases family 38 N-terminal domain-containing protein [Zychaea mexicana]|uniref:glycosyl hydrolases family 38 N-terminal domain-containing protein n=1 Tax=Zychaea mexicana TaxID=64656 RepID=UPI0022FE7ED7|nr:glycosyl hydrolases family 38 N-terminal domain-containing protein [Zychaea mexicana]KAI9489855.1 glycosyl hydrolases family 38 N-terminal domain-containing protein [Zychaea mexicana]